MKGAQLAINILLFILVLLLFYFQFSRNSTRSEPEQNLSTDSSTSSVLTNTLQVRYINTDSIWAQYSYVEELNASLKKKQKQYEAELDKKFKEFQDQVEKFRTSAATMSMQEGQKKQEELMQKEQQLQVLQEEYNMKLLEEEAKMKKELREKISSFLKGYKTQNVDLIIDNSSGSSVLFHADSLDITSEVVAGLNASSKE